jgi:hypothetical protein
MYINSYNLESIKHNTRFCISVFVLFTQGLHYVAQAGLELMILPQPPECWSYRCVPSCLACISV